MASDVIVLPGSGILAVMENNSCGESSKPWYCNRIEHDHGGSTYPLDRYDNRNRQILVPILDSGFDFPQIVVTIEFLCALDLVAFLFEFVQRLAIDGE